jgi:hypothetical protein
MPVSDGSVSIRTDGVYFADKFRVGNEKFNFCDYYIFKKDGTCIIYEAVMDFWAIEKFDSDFKESLIHLKRGDFYDFGVYSIKDSTITIQRFFLRQEPLENGRRVVENIYCKIINDTTLIEYGYETTYKEYIKKIEHMKKRRLIDLENTKVEYFDKNLLGFARLKVTYNEPKIYYFHPYYNEELEKLRPAFSKKLWYKRKIHESRKKY